MQGNKFITAGANPMILKKGIDIATVAVVEELKKMAKPIKSRKEIRQVADISSANPAIGSVISEAMDKVGNDGLIAVEEGGNDLDIVYTEGMEFDKGYASAYFTTNQDTQEAEIKDALILITDKRISTTADIIPFLEGFIAGGRKNLVIIADTVEGEALAFLVVNKLNGKLPNVVVKAPGFGDKQKGMLEDIAVLTGGKFISSETGQKIDGSDIDGIVGRAKSVIVGADFCRIIGGAGAKKDLDARIELIKKQAEGAQSAFQREQLRERLSKLAGGVALITVGALTDTELRDRKERVKDAVSATKAAIEEGILPGGGVALLKARQVLKKLIEKATGDEKFGIEIIYNALRMPVTKILENAGEEDQVVVNTIELSAQKSFGFNIMDRKYGNMYEEGVVDPTKVTRSALENASSIGSMVLTTKVLISNIPLKKEA